MTDIKERLLERSQNLWTSDKEFKDNILFREAADEIDCLHQEIGFLRACCSGMAKVIDTTMKDMAQ
jgi:hypothetical protein